MTSDGLYLKCLAHHLLTKDLFIIRVENEKIISQILGIVKTKMVIGWCKNDKSCYICSIIQKGVLVKYEKYWSLCIYVYPDNWNLQLRIF